MAELRYNPLTKDWVMIASHRQARPQMPKDWCPFCVGSGKVPDDFLVLKYDNDFPALLKNPPPPDNVGDGKLYKTLASYGKCEVILYSKEHTKTLAELPLSHIRKLIDLWCERFSELSADEKIKYVFIFENRGEAVGVTMPHPHGQIYAYSVMPKKIELETIAMKEHLKHTNHCLICDMLSCEQKEKSRIIFENDDFSVFLPFFSEYPYGIFLVPKRHTGNLLDFTEDEKNSLAQALKNCVGMFDSLFDYQFPYMMCMYQNPTNAGDTDFYHFHIAFYPPMRSADKIKFNASSETGVWAHCNPTAPEEKAEELRRAYKKFIKKTEG